MNPQAPIDPILQQAAALMNANRLAEAERLYARAAQLAPLRHDLHTTLCMLRLRLNDAPSALASGRRAVELAPEAPEAWSNLATALAANREDAEALTAARKAIELAPTRPEALLNLGFVHERAGRVADAERAYLDAVALAPQFALSHRNLAALYDRAGDAERAVVALRRALELQPRDVEGWNNLSTILRQTCDYQGSLSTADQALRLVPQHASAHGNRGLALLALGDYPQGFAEYEWRWRCDNFTTQPRDFGCPAWDGSDPSGRTIFVHAEQGFGDVIQFARYLPLLADRGAIVFVEATPPLRALLESVAGVARVIPSGVRPPRFDLHVPLLSLPRLFKSTIDTLPNAVPYFTVDPQRVERIAALLGDRENIRRIGLIWAGNVKPDPLRSCPAEALAGLSAVQHTQFISLQKRVEGRDVVPPTGLALRLVADELRDFADTAAAMSLLDAVVTIDTASAHLAGALGRQTLVMLPYAADWRWGIARADSPWYPTVQLFRQAHRGDWDTVIRTVVACLNNS